MTTPLRLISSRLRGETSAPPPVAMITLCSWDSSRHSSASMVRNAGSPSSAKIALISLPVLRWITSSMSMKMRPSRSATALPTTVLPVPMNPVRTMFW